MVARACGCVQEFQHYAVDKYRAQRLAKFQQTRCPTCAAKLIEEQRRNAPPPKSEALKALPPGTQVTLALHLDGSWSGTLDADGKSVTTTGLPGAGPQTVVVALARLWMAASASGTG
jgi:hypothetical protein